MLHQNQFYFHLKLNKTENLQTILSTRKMYLQDKKCFSILQIKLKQEQLMYQEFLGIDQNQLYIASSLSFLSQFSKQNLHHQV